MPKKIIFTADELKNYFNGSLKGYFNADAVAHEEHLRVHADGVYPSAMIEERRPNEPLEVKDYRKIIWKPKTKPFFTKILNSLSKIRRSADWSISYPDETFTRIPDGETLADYCEVRFPFFTSITNWVFSTLLREYAVDPNAVVVVMPMEVPEDETEFLKPYPVIFNSRHVIDHKEEDYSVLCNPLGSTYFVEGVAKSGKSFYVVTTMQVLRYDQTDDKGTYSLVEQLNHSLGYLPCYRIKGVLMQSFGNDFLYESRLAGVLPEFDEAIREYSDLQASKVMHIYAERWEIATTECKVCNGTGTGISVAPGAPATKCNECDGVGYRGSSPYSKMILTMGGLAAAGGQSIPVPPAGYVEKDVEIVRIQGEGVNQHIREGLGAINMEHLADVPLAQSGVAKEVDRDETNNFVHSVAEDLVRIMDWLYYTIAKYRYGVQYPNDEDIRTMVPVIDVPEHFDLFSTKFVEEELKGAKDNKLNPIILSAMELNYASKKFSSDPDIRDRLMLILELDPLPNISDDEKQARLMNNGILKIDYIISSNIQSYIHRALIDDEQFAQKAYADQRAVLEAFAQEVLDETDLASSLKADIYAEDTPAAYGNNKPNDNGNPAAE